MRYPSLVGMGECAYYGVNKHGEPSYTCDQILTPYERAFIEDSLALARDKLEQVLNFPLAPKWVIEELSDWNRVGRVGPLRWGYIQVVGRKATTTIELGAPLALGVETAPDDPVILIVATTVTNVCEIKIYHTTAYGGGLIEPSAIVADGVHATISIPRCHLVDPTLVQPEEGFDYYENDNFVDEVDVVREYADPSTGSELIWTPTNAACLITCTEYVQTACPTIVDSPLSLLKVFPASYLAGIWTREPLAKVPAPDFFRMSYLAYYNDANVLGLAGCAEIPLSLERAIIRLAHTEMPRRPCMCEWHARVWEEDNEIDKRAPENPFGDKRGQIYAWRTMSMFLTGAGGLM